MVSSHAPVRGHHGLQIFSAICFHVSSHAPVRGHQTVALDIFQLLAVSSHAPVRGHLSSERKRPIYNVCFKSCPREGASRTGSTSRRTGNRFQVMPP